MIWLLITQESVLQLIKHTHLFSSTSQARGFKRWRNASIINQTKGKRPKKKEKKRQIFPLLVLFIMRMEDEAHVPTVLSCDAVVLDAHRCGTCLKRGGRNPLVIMRTYKGGGVQDPPPRSAVSPSCYKGAGRGQSASITRTSSERILPNRLLSCVRLRPMKYHIWAVMRKWRQAVGP